MEEGKQEVVQVEPPTPSVDTEQPSLDDVLESSPTISKADKEPVVDDKKAEIKPDDPGKEAEPEPKQEGPELTEEQKQWKEAHENMSKWRGELTRKSQLIASELSDDDVRNIQAELKLRDQMKDVKPEPLPSEFVFTDEFGDEVTIKSDSVKELIQQEVEKAKQAWIKEVAPQIEEGSRAMQEAKEYAIQARNYTATANIKSYFDVFPNMAFDLGDDPTKTLTDIWEAKENHPDFGKLLKLKAVTEYAKDKGIGLDKAHIELYGESDQKEKARKKIKEEQRGPQSEKPGQSGKTESDDDKVLKSLSGSSGVNVFE